MTIKRLVVLSGISSKVAAKIAPSLRSMATEVVFVKLDSGNVSVEYLDSLLKRAVEMATQLRATPDVKLLGVLVSAIPDDLQCEEYARFFPTLQRFAVEPALRSDVNRGPELARAIMGVFSSAQFEAVTRAATPQQDARFLLPLRNVGLDRLRRHFTEVYEMAASRFSRRLDRDIMRMKKGSGYRVRDLNFKGVVNDGTHPIRKCTDSHVCDLQAVMRFGVSVPDRFEFDVTCGTALHRKTFYLCDGSADRPPAAATHLNMRINDDFMPG